MWTSTFQQNSANTGTNNKSHFSSQNSVCSNTQARDSKSRCSGQQSNLSNTQVKDNKSRCSAQQSNRNNTQVKDNKSYCNGQQSNRSNTQVKNEKSYSSSQQSNWSNSQVKNEKSYSSSQQSSWSNSQVKNEKSCSSSQQSNWNNSQSLNNKSNSTGQNSSWSNTAVQNNASSINLGDYSIALQKSDSSLLLTNNQTGNTTKVWGDPHLDTNGTSTMFNGSLTFDLPDNTKVTVGTQPQGSVSYADQVTITQGNKAYVVNGLSQVDGNPLTVERSGNGRQLDQQTADGYTLIANSAGTGWIDPLTGKAPTAADISKA